MVGQQLLRERLVAGEDQPARVAAGVPEAQQLEVADDVLVEGRDAGKRLHQVEDDVRLEEPGVGGCRRGRRDAEHAHLVTHLAQRLDDVVLHLPLGLEDVDAGGVLGRDEVSWTSARMRASSQEQPVPAAVQVVHRLHGQQHRELLPRLSSGTASAA
jgi:hypothetical protein